MKSAITHKVGGKRTIFGRVWKGWRRRSKRKILREALEKGGGVKMKEYIQPNTFTYL